MPLDHHHHHHHDEVFGGGSVDVETNRSVIESSRRRWGGRRKRRERRPRGQARTPTPQSKNLAGLKSDDGKELKSEQEPELKPEQEPSKGFDSLWLRYVRVSDQGRLAEYRSLIGNDYFKDLCCEFLQ